MPRKAAATKPETPTTPKAYRVLSRNPFEPDGAPPEDEVMIATRFDLVYGALQLLSPRGTAGPRKVRIFAPGQWYSVEELE